MAEPTIMFAGGGTGGHIYPGIAVADCWKEHHSNSQPVFVGSGRKIETNILEKTSYTHEVVPFESPRNILRHPFRFYRNWRISTRLAREYLSKYQPDVVIGLGGFASYPIIREAARSKIPIILLEQNVIPGRATTYLSRWANCICTTYDQTKQHFPKHQNIKTTGNPVRKEIVELAKPAIEPGQINKPLLLIQGGSQGAEKINQAMVNFLQENSASLEGWQVRHQAGESRDNEHVSQLTKSYQSANIEADVRPYFSSPTELYERACFAICRAGGTTLAEMHTLQLPALIIPIANSIRNHQLINAMYHAKNNTGSFVHENSDNFQERFNKELERALKNIPSAISSLISDLPEKPTEESAFLVLQEIHHLTN